ncbi:MAG: patatin-like phospholipase family protein, partial [Cyanobacteria bacterium J06555_3]
MTSQQTNKFIGLALSGGGSRAVAFHLGCLRALNRRGLLDKVEVLSAVSGGSVIAAMYAYSDDSFDEFDKRVSDFLRRGIQKDIALKFFLSYRVIAAIGTVVIAGTYSVVASKLGLKPLPRWTSRTDSFIEVLRNRLFENKKVTAPTRDNLKVIFNATELRTATAFRFGNQSSSCWRYGRIHNNDIEVAEAVAASAAYPLLLPALHRTYSFQKYDNPIEQKRVVITDGGVFDNSGVTCLEPGRNSEFT